MIGALWHVFKNIFLKFFWHKYDLFNGIILLIFLEQCDFLKLTMQGFQSNKINFLNEYLLSYPALAYPVFQKSLFSQITCVGF